MSTLQLDRSDPGVDEMVSAWKDGGTYKVMLTITQKNSSPNMGNFEVTEVVNESPDEGAAVEAKEAPSPTKKPTRPPVEVVYS